MNRLRNLNVGYFVIMLGLGMIVSATSMNDVNNVKKTFLCFDKGCIYVQSFSNLIIGILCNLVGLYLIFKTKLNRMLF